MNKHLIGALGEKQATRFLKRKGYRILAKNKHESHNELDIIAANKHFIVFVEVKTRTVETILDTVSGLAASAVNYQKQNRTIAAARKYLSTANKKQLDKQIRFDVIEVYLEKEGKKLLSINHIESAFTKQ